jgi:hypothetical protein
MCKGFDSLSGIVILELKANVLIQAVFILMNKKHNQVKLPSWKGDGFAMQATLVIFDSFYNFSLCKQWFSTIF